MEVTTDIPYIVERAENVSVLSDFFCGIKQMDDFIHQHDGLKLYVESKLTNLWIIRRESLIIGIFALSKSSLILNSYDVRDVKTENSENLETIFEQVESFPALKIDYLAIRNDFRGKRIGSEVVGLIREKILDDRLSATMFIIVEAYDTMSYSSVGFYRKNYFKESEYGLVKNQNKRREGKLVDTKLMYLPLIK